MAKKKKTASAGNEMTFIKTAINLARKGKTNKKLKRNPLAMKYETADNIKVSENAKAFVMAHPKGTGYKYKKNK